MQYRDYKSLTLSEVGIGSYGLSSAYGDVDIEATIGVLLRAYELGVNYFDTAEAYGDSERILGELVKPFRDKVHIATKVGVREDIKPDLSPDYVKSACEDSLQRLGTEYIDLYQVHFDDPHTPVEETVAALEGLVQAGKIRHYGLGHLPLERVKDYFAVGDVFSVLMEFSAAARQARESLLPLCRQHGVGAIAFSVTGRGLLSGKYQSGHEFAPGDIRGIDPLFQRERLESGLRITRKLGEVGARYGKSPLQAGIAWVLAQPGIICALTGPSTLSHLEENLGGSGWHISEGDLAELDAFFEREDEWLASEQMASLRRILKQPLQGEAPQAFKDLVYVIETAVQLNLTSEAQVMPIFQKLYVLREKLDVGAKAELERVRRKLRSMLAIGL